MAMTLALALFMLGAFPAQLLVPASGGAQGLVDDDADGCRDEGGGAAGPSACSLSLLQSGNAARARGHAGAGSAAAAATGEEAVGALETAGNASVAALLRFLKEGRRARLADPKVDNGVIVDMNGRSCGLCNDPIPERVDRVYTKRTDCGNSSMFEHAESWIQPLITFDRPGTNGWCELNEQKLCADALYNKDFLYQAKAVDYPREVKYDPIYCKHNGWLAPELKALQHDFEGMQAKAEEFCNSDTYKHTGWNTTMTMTDMMTRYIIGSLRGYPTEEEAIFIGGWTCAMGSAGCDIAYCAYSFCDKGDGTYGMYDECEGWDPVKGMPVPESK